MMLSAPASSADDIRKQVAIFEARKKEYDKSLIDITKGQNIQQLEVQAKAKLEAAKEEAATIVANAKRGVEQVNKTKCEYEAMKAKIEEVKTKIEADKIATERLKAEAEKAKAELMQAKGELKIAMEEVTKRTAYLKSRTESFKQSLADFNASIT